MLFGTNGLYEARIQLGSDIWRVFCFFDNGKLVVLLNGFIKKTQKTPKNEICIYAVISSLTISYGQITPVSLHAASKASIKINLLVSLRFNSYTWVYEPALLSAADS